ncbi:MAG: hypothetical protein KAI47_26465 [Deltaproteobacteria bacterium]|nr:hypothetical protein [Deltaproteobacteria bacterium]
MIRSSLVVLFALLLMAPGCKKSADKGTPIKGQPKSVKEKAPKAAAAAAGTPDGVIRDAIAAVKARKPVALYALVPPSYQKDIQGLVSEVTSKMDKEIFDTGIEIFNTAVAAVAKHGDKVAGELKGAPFDAKKILGQIKEAEAMLKAANVLTYDGFKKFEVAAFVNAHGAKLMTKGMLVAEDLMKRKKKGDQKAEPTVDELLSTVKAKLIKAEGDKALIALTVQGRTKEKGMTKVDGHWVPEKMAKHWKRDVERAKAKLAKGMDQLVKNKAKIKKMMAMVLVTLKELEKTGDIKKAKGLMKKFR